MSTPVEQIKARLSIEDVVSSYIKLDPAGKNFKGKCPFHNEKTPSFFISPDRGTYYCFGCGAKGDIFTFVQEFEGLDFMGALKQLAERAGVELVFDRSENRDERQVLYEVMEHATQFYESMLSKSEEAKSYVNGRGIKEETSKLFRLGYAPSEWRSLHTYLRGKGYTDNAMEKAGLTKKTEKGYYDRFRDRIMFPILDSSGRVIAFSGRIVHDAEDTAKYLNSPDTVLFDKSTVLYGIDKAKSEIRTKGYSILVEGQMDLVLSHQSGVKNTVAVSGTALSDETVSRDNVVNNLGVVRRLSPNIILAFDSDTAGRRASMRSAQIALSLGMDVKIADLPEGKDPADLVRDDPESWKDVLRGAKPVVEFALDDLLRQKITERKLPTAIKEKVLPFVASIPGRMSQAPYIKMIRERTEGIYKDEGILWEELAKIQVTEPKEGQKVGSKGHEMSTAPWKDAIARRLFGAVYFAQSNPGSGVDADGTIAAIKQIAGVSFGAIEEALSPLRGELLTEVEVLYSGVPLKSAVDELLLNFEEETVRQAFTRAMNELSKSEKTKDDKRAVELMKECQVLSIRLSEITKKRANY
jgi:DNA primase